MDFSELGLIPLLMLLCLCVGSIAAPLAVWYHVAAIRKERKEADDRMAFTLKQILAELKR